MTGERLVVIGEIGRPHGLRGEMRVTPLTDDPERFAERHASACCGTARATRASRVASPRTAPQGGAVVLCAGGLSTRSRRRGTLVGRLLAIPEAEALPLADGHFYPWQLEGCRVVDGRRARGRAGDRGSSSRPRTTVGGRAGDREHLIPAVAEIVLEVDLARAEW